MDAIIIDGSRLILCSRELAIRDYYVSKVWSNILPYTEIASIVSYQVPRQIKKGSDQIRKDQISSGQETGKRNIFGNWILLYKKYFILNRIYTNGDISQIRALCFLVYKNEIR